eukprot:CAMPEP_0169223882 /NCGR_PEP_ID=MMETSP1016-20121227/22359_1 /TAXON_ID=342587 /ORGANISM="Karlodinium micrum, Strain CCMP2283" /LENGTH=56 /DNA_ID=CAMNT_0009302267 /DNA_START=329 /DNA_END=499 /DNA_ORIENTATION=+
MLPPDDFPPDFGAARVPAPRFATWRCPAMDVAADGLEPEDAESPAILLCVCNLRSD